MHARPCSSTVRVLAAGVGLMMAAAVLVPAGSAEGPIATRPAERIALGDAPRDKETTPRITITAADTDRLRLVCDLPEISVQAVTVAGETYHLLEIEGGAVTGRVGQPMLPTFSRLLEIPDEAGVSVRVTRVETTELAGYRPFPLQPDEGQDFVIDRAAYARAGWIGEPPVRVGEPALGRNLRVVPLTLSPVRYDPARDVIEISRRMEIEVRFAGTDLRNARSRRLQTVTPSFDRLYRNLVVNYQGPREGQEIGQGSYVLICRDNADVVARLQPLVAWRTRKGFEVHLATTAETGTSASQIQAWLRNAYNTWENPPEFITLVGDATGSYSIPTYSSNSDFEYAQLDGGDLLADAHVGRISIESLAQLELYVEKIVGYESTPYMDQTDWYTEACLTGDRGSSGISCVQIMQWLKIRLLDYGYTEVDTVFSSPYVSQMTSSMNEGVGIFAYRGWMGMSGFDDGDVQALVNGRKLIYAVNITCYTGTFDGGTAISETWIRAGSPGAPKGGIASVGTATAGTHTRYNNCIMHGIWRGVYWEQMWTFGGSLTRGFAELYINYAQGDPGAVSTWCRYNNLMGDAAGELWTAVPANLEVDHPASAPLGANAVIVTVHDHGLPIAGADVCLWKDGETHVVERTANDGTAELAVDLRTAGELLVTVTKHDHHPYLGSIAVAQADHFVGYAAHQIDDDTNGTSSGNADGAINPTEQIELPVQVRNHGTQTEQGIVGTLSCDDPYVTILDGSESFGDLMPGASAWSSDDFDLLIDGGAPNGHLIRCGLDLQAGAENWHSLIDLPVVAAEFRYDDYSFTGPGGQPDPGEEGGLTVTITNVGAAAGSSVTATLSSGSSWVTVTDAQGGYGNIGIGVTDTNTGNPFRIAVAADCYPGHIAPLTMRLSFSGGARDTIDFAIQVGTAATTDPSGPDAYGYYAFDNTDSGYLDAPVYEWVEIAPNHGGPGTDVGLDDPGGNVDDSRTVDLPFPFVFYGEEFTQATICSNGWLSMGATYLENRRNWNIPAAGGPPYLIAPMWDNLYESGEDQVYHWYDETHHRYIVQWSRLRNFQGASIENFEAILYDPEYYPTASGDGEILFQYETFNNSDYLQHYCTVGIENGDHTDGICYSYFNYYGPGAASIPTGGGRAIKFTPISAAPRGVLTGTITNVTNGGTPIPGATVHVIECDRLLTSGPDGVYQGLLPVGIYTVAVTHASFAPDTARNVWVVSDQTTVRDFALEDILPPLISGTTDLPNTGDDVGPYEVTTTITEFSDFTTLALRYNARGTGWIDVPLSAVGDDRYRAEIPGQMHGSLVKYYIVAEDVGGLGTSDPPDAPWESYEFWVLAPLFADDCEAGAGEWTHYVVTPDFVDQWHLSEQQNHTLGGSWAWKFGDPADGNYADLADGALESGPLGLDAEVTLIFWHWMDAEVSQAHAGYAYDGGLVEISLDGGPWTQITPVGGYPYLVREGSTPGPLPAETPIFSGTHDWQEARFELGMVTGALRFRFRFGSDGAVNQIGWYLDDVQLISSSPGTQSSDEAAGLPTVLALHPARPNPFGGGWPCTRLRFDLPRPGHAQLEILDVAGRRVRGIVEGNLPAGHHEVAWDARDLHGQRVACGVYFYVLETAGTRLTRRMLVVR